jgi:hypothetical protein
MKNFKRFIYVLIILAISFYSLIGGGCAKHIAQPEQTLLWENSTNDTVYISINGTKHMIGLYPYQAATVGDDSWLDKTYIVMGNVGSANGEKIKVERRNTIH